MLRGRSVSPRLMLAGALLLAGGYAVQGIAGTFVVKLVGSYSNVVGLPLYETISLLGGEGYPIRFGWLNVVSAA